MGRTVPSITRTFYSELKALSQFKRALRRSDQLVFDELFANARLHLAEAAYAWDMLSDSSLGLWAVPQTKIPSVAMSTGRNLTWASMK